MTLPSTAILMLRGLEGCGVTNYARHMQAFFHQEESTCDIFALAHITKSKIGRPDTSKDIEHVRFKYEQRAEIVERLNQYDLVLLFSTPPKSAFPEVETYVEDILNQITKPLVFINHDHNIQSFRRNLRYKDAIEACDKMFCHSLLEKKKGFVTWAKNNEVDATFKKLPIFYHIPLLEDYITLTKEGRDKTALQAGRYSSWKRTTLFLNLHPYLKAKGFYTIGIGLERSPGYVEWSEKLTASGLEFWVGTLPDGTPFNRVSAGAQSHRNTKLLDWLWEGNKEVDKIYSVGPYEYYAGMRETQRSAFAFHCRSFETSDLDYGNNPEFQTLECMLLSVPVAHRHFLQTVTLPGEDTTLAKTGVFLTISDDGGPANKQVGHKCINGSELVEEMENIWNDDALYEKHRKAAVDLVHNYYSTDKIIPNFIQECLE